MLNWDLKKNDDKIALLLSGELSRNTLLPMWQQRDVFFTANALDKQLLNGICLVFNILIQPVLQLFVIFYESVKSLTKQCD